MTIESSYAESFMHKAIAKTREAIQHNEVPIACVVVLDNHVIAEAHNETISRNSPLAHAEMLALEKAAQKIGDWRLNDCDIFVTVEPCVMCFGAMQLARIRSLYYGASNNHTGAWSGPMQIYHKGLKTLIFHGILEETIEKIMKDFFESKRRGG
jgi:tRNA(adenine34) deaminase